jgi:peptidoglycan/LPS O-acetylase OafA/YrhL
VPAKSAQRIYGLDHLRAYAIASVFGLHCANQFHFGTWLPHFAKFGWSGVDLFFVLSGYLIGGQLLRQVASGQGISIRDFYLQRFLRIIPAYWLVLVIYFTFPIVIERGRLPPLWRFITFTQNFGLNQNIEGTFSHAWSLCVEEHFYLLVPGLILISSRFNWKARAFHIGGLLMLLGVAIRSYAWTRVTPDGANWSELIYYPTYCHVDGLIVGVAISAVSIFYPRQWSRIERWSFVWLFAGVGLLTIAYMIDGDQHTWLQATAEFPLVAIAYGMILITAVSPNSVLSRSSVMTKWVATLSYSIYLTHKMVIHLLQNAAISLHAEPTSPFVFVLCIFCAVACGYVLHVAVERPFMRLRNRLCAPNTALFVPTSVGPSGQRTP